MLTLIFNINHESVEMLFLWKKSAKGPSWKKQHQFASPDLQILKVSKLCSLN